MSFATGASAGTVPLHLTEAERDALWCEHIRTVFTAGPRPSCRETTPDEVACVNACFLARMQSTQSLRQQAASSARESVQQPRGAGSSRLGEVDRAYVDRLAARLRAYARRVELECHRANAHPPQRGRPAKAAIDAQRHHQERAPQPLSVEERYARAVPDEFGTGVEWRAMEANAELTELLLYVRRHNALSEKLRQQLRDSQRLSAEVGHGTDDAAESPSVPATSD